ncbi:hypothetical protein [Actinoplanes sp. NPDC020271]|uniref:hypothetical protein n=1 Tax=Actinoplanes sp. NPDC020271 TaxID=3363896 RepID=UPI0037B1DB26
MKDTHHEPVVVHFQGVEFPDIVRARWALCFEDLRMSWSYRPRRFELSDGEYEPDFWLNEHKIWFQVGDVLHDADHLRWRRFAARVAENMSPAASGSRVRDHLRATGWPLVTEAALFSVGGIPRTPAEATGGPRPRPTLGAAMYSADGSRCRWVSCFACGWIGAEPYARDGAEPRHAHDVRADAPRLLAAYRLARQANPAMEINGNGCARCRAPLALGDLIAAGSKINNRRWYHAMCLLQSRRERYGERALPVEPDPDTSRVQKSVPMHGRGRGTKAA